MSGEDIKTKICSKCGKELPMTDEYFSKYRDRYRSDCKECEKKRYRKYYETHKGRAREYQTKFYEEHKEKRRQYDAKRQLKRNELLTKWRKPCQKCGEQRLYLIQFHHIDPTTKEFNVSTSAGNKKTEIVEEEVKKCVCLCSNCHDEFHYFYGKNPEDPVNAIKEYLKE